jgi:hypothetical protein
MQNQPTFEKSGLALEGNSKVKDSQSSKQASEYCAYRRPEAVALADTTTHAAGWRFDHE